MQRPPRTFAFDPKEKPWLSCGKADLGRASKNEFIAKGEIGEEFSKKGTFSPYTIIRFCLTCKKNRAWHCAFHDYYDVYTWHLEPGLNNVCLYNIVFKVILVVSSKGLMLIHSRLSPAFIGSLVCRINTTDPRDTRDTNWKH